MKHEVSDEQLNAFIDDELDVGDRDRILADIASDRELAQRACALRLTKEQVRHAYAQVPTPARRISGRTPWRALATVAMVCAAAFAGWFGHERMNPPEATLETSARLGDTTRIVLHVASADAQLGAVALTEAENLLRTARESGQPIAVELVANAGGLDLLRADTSPYVQRIAQLRAENTNFTLVACGNTVQRLQEKGIHVRLLPGTLVASSALDQIVTRLKQGWSYIRV